MRFQSARNPDETGALALSQEGTVRIDPSDAMIEKIALLEQDAVECSARYSSIASVTLITLGLVAAGIGWAAGRLGGRLRERLAAPRPVGETKLTFSPERGVRLQYKDGPMGTATFEWAPGEYNLDEAEAFVEVYDQFKRVTR